MVKFVQKLFSFRISDVLGIIVGIYLVFYCSDMELFYLVTSPQLYFLIFLSMLLLHSYAWLCSRSPACRTEYSALCSGNGQVVGPGTLLSQDTAACALGTA